MKCMKNEEFQKPKNLGLMHEVYEEWRIKDPYQWRRTRSRPKITWERSLEWKRKVLGGEEIGSIERDWGEWEKIALNGIYRKS